LDRDGALTSTVFAAVDFDHIPHCGPEEVNICAVVDRQDRADASIAELTHAVESLLAERAESATKSECAAVHKVETVVDAVNVHLTAQSIIRLNDLMHCVPTFTSLFPLPRNAPVITINDADRSMNIVVYGVAEDKTSSTWHARLAAALQHVAGRPVDISRDASLTWISRDLVRSI
jgi:hypothetical protein